MISRDTILKYLKGELSDQERFDFEKAMLDDPFLNDAIEGLKKLNIDELEYELANIKLSTRKNKPRLLYWVAAASVLIAFVSIMILLQPDIEKNITALNESEQEVNQTKEEVSEIESTQSLAEDKEVKIAEELDESVLEKPAQVSKDEDKPEEFSIVEETETETRVEENPVERDEVSLDAIVENEEIAGDAEAVEAQTVEVKDAARIETQIEGANPSSDIPRIQGKRAKSAAENFMPNPRLSGRIFSTEGPLENVNIYIERGPGIFSAQDGSFDWELISDAGETVVIKNGFEDKSGIAAGNIFMIASKAKSEYEIVSRYQIIDVMPGPEGGRNAYLNYLSDQLQYPDEAKQKLTEGIVSVSFRVNKNGNIRDIEVLQALENGCTEEALRLIKDGPKWNPGEVDSNRITSTVFINIIFKL